MISVHCSRNMPGRVSEGCQNKASKIQASTILLAVTEVMQAILRMRQYLPYQQPRLILSSQFHFLLLRTFRSLVECVDARQTPCPKFT